MSKFNLNNFYLSIYKTLGFSVLTSMVIGIVAYTFVLGFYTVNRSWAAPLALSPTQERVLTYQPQIAALEANLNKQKVEQATAVATVSALTDQIKEMDSLLSRVGVATKSEAAQMAVVGKSLTVLADAKKQDIAQSDAQAVELRKLLKQTDEELAAKLITSDVAASRKASLQQALNATTDAKAQLVQLQDEARRQQQSAATFSGDASSLSAIGTIKQVAELRALRAQLEIQLAAATANVKALAAAAEESERVLNVAKTSPYYRALREKVTVAFLPYDNLNGVKEGDAVYDCYLQVIACQKVGTVARLFNAEEYARHPLFRTDLKGRLVEVKFDKDQASESKIIFIGGKPLLV